MDQFSLKHKQTGICTWMGLSDYTPSNELFRVKRGYYKSIKERNWMKRNWNN